MIRKIRSRLLPCALILLIGPCCSIALPVPRRTDRAHSISLPEDRVDINSATLDQLLKIPGMTRTWAVRIIRFRPYRAKNDLIDRGVLSNEVYNRIKGCIVAHRSK